MKYNVTTCYRVDIYNEAGEKIRYRYCSTKDKAVAEGERLVKALEEDPYYGRPFSRPARDN